MAEPRADNHAVLPLRAAGVHLVRDGRVLLDGIDVSIEGDGLSVVLGPNGAGKSLLLRVLAGLVRPDSGGATWAGRAPDRRRATRVGFVFQKPVMLRRSVRANLEFALAAAGVGRQARRRQARALLTEAGLAHLADTPARLLSGGEQQRIALLRALAPGPQVLLLDEPTASLDPQATFAIEQTLAGARRAGTRIVLVTHDLGQARRLADELLFMHRGALVERGSAGDFHDQVQHPAARAFLSGRLPV